MDVSTISTYTDYLTKQNMKADELRNTLNKTDYSDADDEKLLDACKQFESGKTIEETAKLVDCIKSDDDSDPNQNLVDYFRENTLQELASTSTEKEGLGIAQMLYEQMKRNYNL